MQKVSGYTTTPSSGANDSKPLDPDSMGLVLPVSAMAIASYAGYKLANSRSDEEAAAERKARIKQNMNKLGKVNLALLREVRKEALGPAVGTFVNPFQGQVGFGDRYVPKWFKPSGAAEPSKADSMLFHALALAATYGAGTAGVKYLLNRVEREKERKQGNVNIEEAVKASMPIVSPDPSLKDLAKEEKESMRGLKSNIIVKESAERATSSLPKFVQDALLGIKNPKTQSLTGSAKAAIMLLAAGAFGTGAILTKQWADERDPNRERMKAAEKAAKRRSMQERPPAIVGAIDPKIKEQLNKHITGGRLRIQPQLDGGMATQEVDPTDTLSRNIAVV